MAAKRLADLPSAGRNRDVGRTSRWRPALSPRPAESAARRVEALTRQDIETHGPSSTTRQDRLARAGARWCAGLLGPALLLSVLRRTLASWLMTMTSGGSLRLPHVVANGMGGTARTAVPSLPLQVMHGVRRTPCAAMRRRTCLSSLRRPVVAKPNRGWVRPRPWSPPARTKRLGKFRASCVNEIPRADPPANGSRRRSGSRLLPDSNGRCPESWRVGGWSLLVETPTRPLGPPKPALARAPRRGPAALSRRQIRCSAGGLTQVLGGGARVGGLRTNLLPRGPSTSRYRRPPCRRASTHRRTRWQCFVQPT